MIITESQLRLIVRQELLEVLKENDTDLLEEGKLGQLFAKFAFPLVVAFGGGASLGTAIKQSGEALSGGPAVAQVARTIGASQIDKNELPVLSQQYINSLNPNIKFDVNKKQLSYKGIETKIDPELIKQAKAFVSLDPSGKSNDVDKFMNSPQGKTFTQSIQSYIDTNPELSNAVEAQDKQNLSLAIALMCLTLALITGVHGADITTKDRK
jgi:hypothetical protein